MTDYIETTDAPEDISTPYSILPGDTFLGSLETAGDRDWIAVTLIAGHAYQVSLSRVGVSGVDDTYLRLYDQAGTQVAADDDGGLSLDSLLTYPSGSGGPFFISAESYADSHAGDYRLEITDITRFGSNSDDTLILGSEGTSVYARDGDDLVHGSSGRDNIFGGDGNDLLFGDGNADRLYGGAGHDTLSGGYSHDTLYGGDGEDLLSGGNWHDTLYGGDGEDRLFGGTSGDVLYGGADNDRLFGMEGYDAIYSGTGNDRAFGGTERDRLHGGDGDDLLSGNKQGDWLFGGAGDDTLHGGRDDDRLTGGADADVFLFDFGHDTINDFEDNIDRLLLENALWTGTLTVDEVISTYATTDGTDTVFDFGNGVMLDVLGIADPTQLANDIVIV